MRTLLLLVLSSLLLTAATACESSSSGSSDCTGGFQEGPQCDPGAEPNDPALDPAAPDPAEVDPGTKDDTYNHEAARAHAQYEDFCSNPKTQFDPICIDTGR